MGQAAGEVLSRGLDPLFGVKTFFADLDLAESRAGEPRARLIFQITPENRSQCRGVRTVDAKTLLRTSKVSPLCGVDHG